MTKKGLIILFVFLILIATLGIGLFFLKNDNQINKMPKNEKIILPQPEKDSDFSIEKALSNRRSIRNFENKELSLEQVSQLLWAAQGITDISGKRASPSAGATYPLTVYLVVEKVKDLIPGVYKFIPEDHSLMFILEGEKSTALKNAALGQGFIENAPINIVFGAIYEKTTNRYGERGIQYVHMEAGHAAQNIYLQCESLGLGTVAVGAFDEDRVREILNMSEKEIPLYIMPVGKK